MVQVMELNININWTPIGIGSYDLCFFVVVLDF